MSKFYENYKFYLILALIAGIAIRFYGLAIQSFWFDEIYTAQVSSGTYANWYNNLIYDSHPPLYQSMMYVVAHTFGMNETIARFPSAIFGSLALFALYYYSKKYYSNTVSASATIILSLTYYGVAYSQEARSYSLLLLFTIISTFTMIRLIQDKPTNSDYIFYAVVSTITAYTHYFGAILIGLQFVYLLAIAIRYNRNQLKRIIPVELLLVIAYLPWVSVLLFVGRVISSGTFWIPPVQLAYFGEYLKFIFYPDQIILLVSIVLLFILPFLLDEKQFTKRFMAFIRSVKVTSPSFILGYLILGTIIPTYIISVVWHPMLIPRYVLHLAPFIYILGAVWISNCSRLLDWKQTAYTFVVCMICLTLFLPSYYLPHKEQWREASAFAVNESNNKTMMVTLGNAEQDTYRYYLNQSHIPTDLFVYQKRDEENITGATDKMYKLNKNRLVILDTHYTDLSTNDYTLLNSACKTHSKTDFVGINVSVYQF